LKEKKPKPESKMKSNLKKHKKLKNVSLKRIKTHKNKEHEEHST
jgi:hypothetical protein